MRHRRRRLRRQRLHFQRIYRNGLNSFKHALRRYGQERRWGDTFGGWLARNTTIRWSRAKSLR